MQKLIIKPKKFDPLTGDFAQAGKALANLNGMEELDLTGNAFTGKLPKQFADTNNLKSLIKLYLKGNKINDVLPDSWSAKNVLFNLEILDLSDNKLSGKLPSTWGQDGFQKLNKLRLAGNQITGSLPEEWGTEGWWPAFNILDVSRNQISGMTTMRCLSKYLNNYPHQVHCQSPGLATARCRP